MALFLRKLQTQPRKILVARTDRIGDFILTLPVLEMLKRGGMEPSVLCRSLVTPLLENNPFVESIIVVDREEGDPLAEIGAAGFDCLLVLVNDPTIRRLLPRLKGIPVRIGPLSKPSVFFSYTHPVLQKRSRSMMNEAAYNLELLELLGIDSVDPPRPEIYFRPEEKQQFQSDYNELLPGKAGEPLIVFHQGMAGSALNWRAENYFILLSGLLKNGYRVILTGYGEEEVIRNQACMEALKPKYADRLFDMSDKLSLRKLGLLIHFGDLFIGPSTGPTHLAGAVGTEIITFYPPIRVQSTRRWGPYQSPATIYTPDVDCRQKFHCSREKCPDFYCMDRIQPEVVLESIINLLPLSGQQETCDND